MGSCIAWPFSTNASTNNLEIRFKATGNQSGAVESLKDGFEALKVCINLTHDFVSDNF